AEEREPARRGYPGETDPARIVWLVREAVDEAAAGQQYDAVSGSCFGHSLLPLDERGRPLTEILGWRDTRSAGSAEGPSRPRRSGGGVHPHGLSRPHELLAGKARLARRRPAGHLARDSQVRLVLRLPLCRAARAAGAGEHLDGIRERLVRSTRARVGPRAARDTRCRRGAPAGDL